MWSSQAILYLIDQLSLLMLILIFAWYLMVGIREDDGINCKKPVVPSLPIRNWFLIATRSSIRYSQDALARLVLIYHWRIFIHDLWRRHFSCAKSLSAVLSLSYGQYRMLYVVMQVFLKTYGSFRSTMRTFLSEGRTQSLGLPDKIITRFIYFSRAY